MVQELEHQDPEEKPLLRACTTLAFDEFKHPSRKSGKQVIDVFKDLRRQRGYNTYL